MEKDENPEHWADESGDELRDDSFLTNPLPNLPEPIHREKPSVKKIPRDLRLRSQGMGHTNHSSYSKKAHNNSSKPLMRNSFNQKKPYTNRNAGTNRLQNNRDNSKHPPVPPLKSNTEKESKLISNTMAHSLQRQRGNVVVVRLVSGDSFEGVLDTVDVMHGMNVTLLQSQKQVENDKQNQNPFVEMHNIEGGDIVYLSAREKTNQKVYHQQNRKPGFIDSEVGGQRTRKERKLQRWEPGTGTGGEQLCEPLCELEAGPKDEKWDQFQANQALGVPTSMDVFEQTYTTPIDRGSKFYKNNEKKAEEIANQIEHKTVKHKHVLLERGAKPTMSPESMFSQVFPKVSKPRNNDRGKAKTPKKSLVAQEVPAVEGMDPAVLDRLKSGRYIPPHQRKIYEKMGIVLEGAKKDNRAASRNSNSSGDRTSGQHSTQQQQPRVSTPSKREPTAPRRRTPPHKGTPTPRQKGTPPHRGAHSIRNPSPMRISSAPGGFLHTSPGGSQPGAPPSETLVHSKPQVPALDKSGRRERKTDSKPPSLQKKSSLNPNAAEFTPNYTASPKPNLQDHPPAHPQHVTLGQAPGQARMIQGWQRFVQPQPIQQIAVPSAQPSQAGQQNPHHQPQTGFHAHQQPRMVVINGQPHTYMQVPSMQRQPPAQMLMPQQVMRLPQGQQGPQMSRVQPMYIQHQAMPGGKADRNKGHPQQSTSPQQKLPNMPANMQPTSPFQNPLQQPQFFPPMISQQVTVPGMFPQYVIKQGNVQHWPVTKLKNQIPQQMNQQNFSIIQRPGQPAPNQRGMPPWNGNIAQFTGMPAMQNIQNAQSQTPR
jgi:small nuclear ribonucleoprotein (snRNP)-like protein